MLSPLAEKIMLTMTGGYQESKMVRGLSNQGEVSPYFDSFDIVQVSIPYYLSSEDSGC